MAELGIQHVVQGCKDKVAAFDAIISKLGFLREECAYVGDDIPDLPLLAHVGYSIAVANAVPAVHKHCDFSTSASGGFGAVREVCDLILSSQSQHD
jgi:3-deoxy-D-manno-octulosonate 8-phosphate phosphatase (KDO 8-P phosphatase)